MAGVLIASSLTQPPFPLGVHAGAVFSDGKHVAVFYGHGGVSNTSSLAYSISGDNGATWGTVTDIQSTNQNTFQAHWDTCQNGDTLYGAITHWNGSTWQFYPFKLVYASGSITVTVGTAQTLTNFSPNGSNPQAGGTQLTVSWDADHSYFHIAVQATNGVQLYAYDTSLTQKYTKTGATSVGLGYNSTPIVYVRGTIYMASANGSSGAAQYNTITASASAYGTWSADTAFPSGDNFNNGAVAELDTTQSPTQPMFAWSSQSGFFWIATYSGSAWTITKLTPPSTPYGAGLQCVGNDIWATLTANGTQIVKRVSGTWGSFTQIDASGDRNGWTSLGQSSGTLLLTYMNGAGTSVYSFAYTLASTLSLVTTTRAKFLVRMVLSTTQRAKFSVRTGLTTQTRARFYSRVALQAQTRAKFLIAKVLKATTRARFVVRTGLTAATRARFYTRVTLTEQTRSRFFIRNPLLSAARATFKILASGTKALTTTARVRFIERMVLDTPGRARFSTRFTQQTTARARFAIRFSLVEQTRARFFTRVALQAQTRARFITRLALTARTRSSFLIRRALLTPTVSKFLIFFSGRSLPLLTTHNASVPWLSVTGNAAISKLTVTGGLSMVTPFSTINSPITVKDTANNPVTNLGAAALTVTYPDGTTATFSLGNGVQNSGAGVYTATYNTKDFGRIQEDWALTAADGVTVAKARFTIPVTYQGV